MTADRWLRIKELFHAALEQPAHERAAFLQQACGDDAEGRAEIERLLAAHLEASSFIEQSPLAGLLTTDLLTPLTGRVMGHYRLEHLLGVGGMGVVYAARDIELERVVALKVVNSDKPDAQLRLRREAQRASRLNHPHICTIHEAGVSDGMTYFVMEHVDGDTLSAAMSGPGPAARNRAPVREPDRRGAGACARPWHHPPRSEKRERDGHPRRTHQDSRFWRGVRRPRVASRMS